MHTTKRSFRHFLLIFIWLGSAIAQGGMQSEEGVEEKEVICPTNIKEWTSFREELAQSWSSRSDWSSNDIGLSAEKTFQVIRKCTEKSSALFLSNLELRACMKNLNSFMKGLKQFKGTNGSTPHRYGANVPDHIYLNSTSLFTEIPEDVKTNQAFLNAASVLETSDFTRGTDTASKKMQFLLDELKKMNSVREAKGLPVILLVPFNGDVKAAGSRSTGRLLLFIPGNPEQMFSLGLSKGGIRSPQFSAVAIHKNSKGERHTYFKDHWRQFDDNTGEVRFENVSAGKFGDSCWKCHKSGPISIPVDKTAPDWVQEATQKVNKNIFSYGLTGSGGFSDSTDIKIGWGGNSTERREKLFPYCVAASVSQGDTQEFQAKMATVRKDKVIQAMNCTSCHDGLKRGRLSPPFDDVIWERILLPKGNELAMPPGNGLTSEEKYILKKCLDLEFKGVSKEESHNGITGLKVEKDIPGTLFSYFTETNCD